MFCAAVGFRLCCVSIQPYVVSKPSLTIALCSFRRASPRVFNAARAVSPSPKWDRPGALLQQRVGTGKRSEQARTRRPVYMHGGSECSNLRWPSGARDQSVRAVSEAGDHKTYTKIGALKIVINFFSKLCVFLCLDARDRAKDERGKVGRSAQLATPHLRRGKGIITRRRAKRQ